MTEDGEAGIEIFGGNRDAIECVVLDATMPGISGEETVDRLRVLRNDVPVILSSGFGESEMLKRFEGRGLAGFIQKFSFSTSHCWTSGPAEEALESHVPNSVAKLSGAETLQTRSVMPNSPGTSVQQTPLTHQLTTETLPSDHGVMQKSASVVTLQIWQNAPHSLTCSAS